jgi:hypothetical protein
MTAQQLHPDGRSRVQQQQFSMQQQQQQAYGQHAHHAQHAQHQQQLQQLHEVERRVRATIDFQDRERGYTALHYATSHSCLTPATITLRLLELDANPNIRSTYKAEGNAAPIHFAMTRQDMNAILPLLSDVRTD